MSALPGPLREYDRGPGGLASLVGGLLGGVKAGYEFKQQITADKEAAGDRGRKRLEDAIRLRIELENAGYDPDDLGGGQQAPVKTPSARVGTPGFNPNAPDPRDYGGASPDLPGFAGLDPNQAPNPEEVANPFRMPERSVDPGFSRGSADPSIDPGFSRGPADPNIDPGMAPGGRDVRSRVADVLFQGTPRMRKTGESAQERRDRVAYERQTSRDSAQDAGQMERERFQQGAQDARQGQQLGAQERMNTADNRQSERNARIAASSREDVARLRPGSLSADPAMRRLQMAIQVHKNQITGLNQNMAQVQRGVGKQPPDWASPQEKQAWEAKASAAQATIGTLQEQLIREQAIQAALGDRLLQGDPRFEDLLPQAGAQAQPYGMDIRGRPSGRGAVPAGPVPSAPPTAPAQQAPTATKRPLSATEKAKAQSEPGFQQFLSQRGYGPQDWQ